MSIVNSFYSYEENGTGAWHRPGKPNDYDYTLDHILINTSKIKEIVTEGGVIDLDLPADHRITVVRLKVHKVDKTVRKQCTKVKKVNLDYSKLINDKKIMREYEFKLYKVLESENLNELMINGTILL